MRRMVQRIRKSESGFTLIEMLIVVGIIVALAAALVPAVVVFSGKGTEGKKASERSTIQLAMDAMMAENGITSVTPISTNGVNDWTAYPAGTGAGLLDSYLPITSSEWYYCYDGEGRITNQNDAPTDSC